ncbi:MAG: hypothetical protein IT359_00715 [Gemmatimonadaceae bacterium]|nr:hypothetical protein [Gemmatimonadaceae bacterium]
MSTFTKVKLALTLIGLILFAYGARTDDATIRAIGIGFVAVAWVMRFFNRARATSAPPGDGDAGTPS